MAAKAKATAGQLYIDSNTMGGDGTIGNPIRSLVGGGNVQGTGTPNALPIWSDAETLGDSGISEGATDTYCEKDLHANAGFSASGPNSGTGIEVDETGADVRVGFFGSLPVVQPTLTGEPCTETITERLAVILGDLGLLSDERTGPTGPQQKTTMLTSADVAIVASPAWTTVIATDALATDANTSVLVMAVCNADIAIPESNTYQTDWQLQWNDGVNPVVPIAGSWWPYVEGQTAESEQNFGVTIMGVLTFAMTAGAPGSVELIARAESGAAGATAYRWSNTTPGCVVRQERIPADSVEVV